MAISNAQDVLNILKVVYADGVNNLLFRNSPVLKAISKERIEGKEYRFACLYGRGGAVSANYNTAEQAAILTARNAEFQVTPGQLFSAYIINQKEILASRTNRGAYMTVAGNKLFAALEASRKTLASALYGTGFGEFGIATAGQTLTVGSNTITLSDSAIMAIDVGSIFQFASGAPNGALGSSINTITQIVGNTIAFNATAADVVAVGDYLVLAGSRDASGNPLLPVGLGAWLPSLGNRTGAAWNTYIGTPFFNVTRSIAPDRLAGQFKLQASGETNLVVLKELFRLTRRAGGECDMLVMNDKRYSDVMAELTPTYFSKVNQPGGDGKKGATIGYGKIDLEFSTSFLDSLIDDPYCPYELAYALETKRISFLTYSNASRIVDDGVGGNEPGKPDPLSENGDGYAEQPQKINVEDFITIKDGVPTQDGPALVVSANLYGAWVVYNPASMGVAAFI